MRKMGRAADAKHSASGGALPTAVRPPATNRHLPEHRHAAHSFRLTWAAAPARRVGGARMRIAHLSGAGTSPHRLAGFGRFEPRFWRPAQMVTLADLTWW